MSTSRPTTTSNPCLECSSRTPSPRVRGHTRAASTGGRRSPGAAYRHPTADHRSIGKHLGHAARLPFGMVLDRREPIGGSVGTSPSRKPALPPVNRLSLPKTALPSRKPPCPHLIRTRWRGVSPSSQSGGTVFETTPASHLWKTDAARFRATQGGFARLLAVADLTVKTNFRSVGRGTLEGVRTRWSKGRKRGEKAGCVGRRGESA